MHANNVRKAEPQMKKVAQIRMRESLGFDPDQWGMGLVFGNGMTCFREENSGSIIRCGTAEAAQEEMRFLSLTRDPAAADLGVSMKWTCTVSLYHVCLKPGNAGMQWQKALPRVVQQGWQLIGSTAFVSRGGLHYDVGATAAPSGKGTGKEPIFCGVRIPKLTEEKGWVPSSAPD